MVNDAYYWERIRSRAAWVSVIQVRLYLLASKDSHYWTPVLNLLRALELVPRVGCEIITGHSDSTRILFLCRVGSGRFRTTGIGDDVHGQVWPRALESLMMDSIQCLGTHSTPGTRNFCLTASRGGSRVPFAFHVHVPNHAAYNVWLSIGFLVLSRFAGICWSLWQNLASRGASISPG